MTRIVSLVSFSLVSFVSFVSLVTVAGGALTGCTTLGPMPTTTGLAAVPSGRTGVEAQAGLVPGYLLSEATTKPENRGEPTSQLLGVVEPSDWLGTGGLVLGARAWGREGDSTLEPFVGYRHRLEDRFAIALFGYGTQMLGTQRGASYRATRVGGELAVDARVVQLFDWLALHGQAAVSTTYIDAKGTYCADEAGLGVDCGEDGMDRLVDGTVHGAFSAATGSIALDFGRMPRSTFHSLRIALLGAAGTMPQLRDGRQHDATRYLSLGFTLTLGIGSPE
jgi:hypothetical protein